MGNISLSESTYEDPGKDSDWPDIGLMPIPGPVFIGRTIGWNDWLGLDHTSFPEVSYLTGIQGQEAVQPGLMGQEWASQELKLCHLLDLSGISHLLLFAHLLILLLNFEDQHFPPLLSACSWLIMVAPAPNTT